jgi:enoyl-CoA hydratase
VSISVSETSGGVAVLTLDRPPANALEIGVLGELLEAVDKLTAAPPRALVITGHDPFFSAGVDLKAVVDYGPDEYSQMVTSVNAMSLGIYGLPCPVIGAITGHAIAGGLILAVCTDVRIASAAGRYGLTEIKVGISYPQAALGVVRAELPPHAARLLVLGNELIDANESHRLGVFDEIVEPDAVLPRALEIAREMATFSPEMYARVKLDLRRGTLDALQAAAASDPLLVSGWLADPTYRAQARTQLGMTGD